MKGVFIFLAGAAVGSAVTYKLVEKHFRDLAEEEIESVKEVFKERLVTDAKDENPNPVAEEVYDAIKEINKNNERLEEIIKNGNYATGVDMAEEGTESQQVEGVEEIVDEEDEDDDSDYTVPVEVGPDTPTTPYVISEEEYGEFGNEEKTLIFYSDSVLADEDDEIVDPESVIGDALKEFEDPTMERVYVRDERSEIDYIVLRSEKSYSEVYGEEED